MTLLIFFRKPQSPIVREDVRCIEEDGGVVRLTAGRTEEELAEVASIQVLEVGRR